MSRTLLITGTDTGIGKTMVTCTLASGLASLGRQVACFKPIASGCKRTPLGLRNEDALQLAQAGNLALPYDLINPVALEPPIAPHLAAAEAGIEIDLPAMAASILAVDADFRLVEGAGGWMVPLGPHAMTADLARACQAEVILVTGIRLGCINHTLLTARAIEADGIPLAGWVANLMEVDAPRADDNIATLQSFLGPPLGICQHRPDAICAGKLAAGLV